MKKVSKKFNIKKEFNDALNLIKKTKWYTVFIISIFCLFFLIGFIFPVFFSEKILEIIKELMLRFEGLSSFQTIYTIFFNNLQASFVVLIIGLFFGYYTLYAAIQNAYLIGFVGRNVANLDGLSSLLQLVPHGIFELPAIFISMGLGLYLANSFLELNFNIKSKKNRVIILSVISLIILPLLIYQFSILPLNNSELLLSQISDTTFLFLGFFNFIQIALLFFVLISSLKNTEMKKRIIQSLKVFVLIVIPLLILAAIIEGILMTL
ncbi:MAG: stage II sporulation protein M [Candidatus Pacearchaeota archaeon]